jgi:hypothetical protein
LKSGTDLPYIQEWLAHRSSKTTEIYTHATTKNLQQIHLPFDDVRKSRTFDNRKQTFAYTAKLADRRRIIAAINEL